MAQLHHQRYLFLFAVFVPVIVCATVVEVPGVLAAGHARLGFQAVGTVNDAASQKSAEYWKIYGGAATAMVVLFLSNLVVLWKITLDSKAAIRKDMSLQIIHLTRERLSKFYDPLFTLASLNADMFHSLGPATHVGDDIRKHEARAVWQKIVEDIILPTNRRMCELILQSSYLIAEDDTLDFYLAFVKHAHSYEVFKQSPNEIHKKFGYPKDFVAHVANVRASVQRKLRDLEHQVGSYVKHGE